MLHCGVFRNAHPCFKILMRRFNHTGCIFVEPRTSLVTDRVSIQGNGFEPNIPITIEAKVDCPSENISFKSFGHYYTCEHGSFNLSKCESVGGRYTGVDDMGLFWSMFKVGTALSSFSVTDASLSKSYNFAVLDGHVDPEDTNFTPLCSTQIERCFLRKDVKRILLKLGNFKATLFTPPGEGPFPAIITLYGGNKSRKVVEDAAAIFANNGFISLAVQYFECEGLPDVYNDEPMRMEQFEHVVDYLLSLENCSSVGVYGTSKGGEIALGMMSLLPKVTAVACMNASVSYTGLTSYGKQQIEGIGIHLERMEILPNGTYSAVNVLDDPEESPSTLIPFEHSSADLLMVVSMDDHNWKSEHYANIAVKKMKAVGKSNYEIIKCPGMGHIFDAPFTPPSVSGGHPLLPKGVNLYYGGCDKKMHAFQQEHTWPKLISFFNRSLKVDKS